MEEKNINVEKEEKEEKKKGFVFFYVVIGVATLIIAIIGASFAYFSATATDNTKIKGETATAGLSMEITHLSTGATAGLIPLNNTDLQKAVTGDTAAVPPTGQPKYCLDKDSNTVCQIYSIELTNQGTAATAVAGKLNLVADTEADANSEFANLKWQLLSDATTVNSEAVTFGTGENTITANTVISGEVGSNTHTWYLVIWVDNINDPQETIDKGHFIGTVTFNAATGTGVVGTFSS